MNFRKINLPENIQNMINTTEYESDTIGMSASSVLLFKDIVLKIEDEWHESENEFQVMKWLNDKLPVPGVLCREKQDGKNYFLMSKARGKMLCDESYMTNPELLVDVLVKALKMLWQINIRILPFATVVSSTISKVNTAEKNMRILILIFCLKSWGLHRIGIR